MVDRSGTHLRTGCSRETRTLPRGTQDETESCFRTARVGSLGWVMRARRPGHRTTDRAGRPLSVLRKASTLSWSQRTGRLPFQRRDPTARHRRQRCPETAENGFGDADAGHPTAGNPWREPKCGAEVRRARATTRWRASGHRLDPSVDSRGRPAHQRRLLPSLPCAGRARSILFHRQKARRAISYPTPSWQYESIARLPRAGQSPCGLADTQSPTQAIVAPREGFAT